MYLFRNNATSVLRQDTPAGSITLTLPSGEGARFPAPVAPDLATVTIEDRRTGQLEICTLTARVADVLTVVRAQENTLAQDFDAGATVSNRMTAGTLAGIQASGTFFYAGPFNVAPIPGPAPGAVGEAGQIMPSPIPPGTQYFNTQNHTIYVWDGTVWFNYTNALPLDGHLAMTGNLQMGANQLTFAPALADNTILDGNGGKAVDLRLDEMNGTNYLKHRRIIVAGTAFGALEEGGFQLNVPQRQLATGPVGGGTGLPMIAVRFFSTTGVYGVGDFVVSGGQFYRANKITGPGAFVAADWDNSSAAGSGIADAPIDGVYYTRRNGAWANITTAGVLSDAPNDANAYVRKGGAWTIENYTNLAGKPSTFPPSVHTHTIAQVTGLQASLDAKASLTDLSTEATNRSNADATLTTSVTANTTAISDEATTRSGADTTLTNNLTTETINRTNADTGLQTQVNAKLGDAPNDANPYVRKGAAWTILDLSSRQAVDANLTAIAGLSDTGTGLVLFTAGAASFAPVATTAQFIATTTAGVLENTNVWAAAVPTTTAYSASLALDFATFINTDITLTGALTLANPTNLKLGRSGAITLIAAADQTLAFGTQWYFATGTKPTTALTGESVLYYYVRAAGKIYATFVGPMSNA